VLRRPRAGALLDLQPELDEVGRFAAETGRAVLALAALREPQSHRAVPTVMHHHGANLTIVEETRSR
jgi:hypothetical protein